VTRGKSRQRRARRVADDSTRSHDHQARPDAVLVDLNMPVVSGVAATRQLIAREPAACVIGFRAPATRANIAPRGRPALAELAGLSPSATSYHLRALDARVVERAEPRDDARERPWRAPGRSLSLAWEAGPTPATDIITDTSLAQLRDAFRRWTAVEATESRAWRGVGAIRRSYLWLTEAEAATFAAELRTVRPLHRRPPRRQPPRRHPTSASHARPRPRHPKSTSARKSKTHYLSDDANASAIIVNAARIRGA
jgi:CheY-like chemotaxis protein